MDTMALVYGILESDEVGNGEVDNPYLADTQFTQIGDKWFANGKVVNIEEVEIYTIENGEK